MREFWYDAAMRMRSWLAWLCAFGLRAVAAEPILAYEAPPFLDGPVVANSLLGTTYAYRSRNVFEPTALQITVVRLPRAALSAGEFSADHCIQLFLTEVARDRSGFFAVPSEKPLEAGPLKLQQVRWTRKDSVDGMTGVTSCGLDQDRYIAINFQDSLKQATATFPAIRSSLKALGIER